MENIPIELPEKDYESLVQLASEEGITPEEMAVKLVKEFLNSNDLKDLEERL